MLYLGRSWFSRLIYGSPDQVHLVVLLASSLFVIISTHYFIDLLTALRNVRFLAVLQFVNSLAFAVLGAVLLFGLARDAGSVILAYAGACLLTSAGVVWWLWPTWRGLPPVEQSLPQREFWGKIVPYVGWVSLTSLMANLFDVADRYMIVHFSAWGRNNRWKWSASIRAAGCAAPDGFDRRDARHHDYAAFEPRLGAGAP